MITPRLMTLQDLFGDRIFYEVPNYQRPYVWNLDDQWQPLWEDISNLATARLTGQQVLGHFLGAIVIELMSAEPERVKEYSVIDGQQSLTTLQIVLAALRSVIEDQDAVRAQDVDRLLKNDGRYAEGKLSFKIWPSETDRPVLTATLRPENGGPAAAEAGIPGAYHYFRGEIDRWLADAASPEARVERVDVLQDTLEGLLQVVAILLDGSSDAQVIFETLNSRGADLASLDLVKNSLLRAAAHDGVNISELHAAHWQPALGDADYWLETVRQGRYTNPRADLFLMHWLTMRTGKVARVQRLFADFRRLIMRAEGAPSAEELIKELSADARVYHSFDQLDPLCVEGRFFGRLDLMDTTTLIPVALLLFRTEQLSTERRDRAVQALESWLVRRMMLGATTAHYNRLLAALLTKLHEEPSLETADDVIIATLRGFENPTDVWPSDDAIRTRLRDQPLYGYINQRKIRVLLEACEMQIADDNRTEQIPMPESLTIEHALPQGWRENWAVVADVNVDLEIAERARDAHVHLLGNLTIVTRGLNAALSNAAWSVKRLELQRRSQLLVNQRLCAEETWDETKIDERGEVLTGYILETWRGPSDPIWGPTGA
jgi:Protein of unknown function DUF262/Protein of unknown function (DUF1524)